MDAEIVLDQNDGLGVSEVGVGQSAAARSRDADGTPALSNAELAERLCEIADEADDGEPKTGRRFYYLALSYGYIQPDMGASEEGKKSRDGAYKRVTSLLGDLRKAGRLDWDMVIDLTRDLIDGRPSRHRVRHGPPCGAATMKTAGSASLSFRS